MSALNLKEVELASSAQASQEIMETDSVETHLSESDNSSLGAEVDSSDNDNGERTETFSEMDPVTQKRCKTGLFVVLCAVFIFLVLVPTLEMVEVDCMEDKIQNKFQQHYDYFMENTKKRDYALMANGLLTDALLLAYLFVWVNKGGSFRFIISLFLMYALRWQFGLFAIRHPKDGNQWADPGFPSLTVQYGTCNHQYYFNPVLGFLTALVAEYRLLKQHILQFLSFVAILSNFYLSLTLKGHYFIDQYGGVVIGFWCWKVSHNWLSYYVDVKLFGLTLHHRFGEIPTSCGLCKTPINDWVQQNYNLQKQQFKNTKIGKTPISTQKTAKELKEIDDDEIQSTSSDKSTNI